MQISVRFPWGGRPLRCGCYDGSGTVCGVEGPLIVLPLSATSGQSDQIGFLKKAVSRDVTPSLPLPVPGHKAACANGAKFHISRNLRQETLRTFHKLNSSAAHTTS